MLPLHPSKEDNDKIDVIYTPFDVSHVQKAVSSFHIKFMIFDGNKYLIIDGYSFSYT